MSQFFLIKFFGGKHASYKFSECLRRSDMSHFTIFFDLFNHLIETTKFTLLHTLLPRHNFQIYKHLLCPQLWTRSCRGPALKGDTRLTYRKYRRVRVAAATKEYVGEIWKMVLLFQKQNRNFVLSWYTVIRILPRDTNKLRCDARHPCHCRTL